DKPELFPIVSRLVELGCELVATDGTAQALRAAGFSPRIVAKIGEEGPTVLDVIVRGEVKLVINTMSNIYEDPGDGNPVFKDGFEIRRAAVERRIPCLTSLDTELGDRVSCLGPLGRGFELAGANAVLISGGLGVAPMPLAARDARAVGMEVTWVHGARTAAELCAEAGGDRVIWATDDGSQG